MALVSHTTLSVSHAKSEVKPPSDAYLALLPPDWPRDVPLARVRTCGTLVVEVVLDLIPGLHGHLEPVYGPPNADLLKIPGMTTAFLLLAQLSSRPDGFASKDFLMQTLPSSRRKLVAKEENDQVEDRVLTRLDNVVSLLRKLLYPPKLRGIPGARDLRQSLVCYVGATDESGPGYRLASFPLLWLDVEAMETYMKEARYLEEHGEDGLEQWQAIYEIGMRGQFLSHEPYSDWADWRRLRVADLLWQSAHAQCKRAQRCGNETQGIEAAQRLLFDFWQRHQSNEDAFRALIEVLRKQERFQQAEECYAQLCVVLDREGYLPHKRTQETMNILRTMRIERDSQKPLLPTPLADERAVEGKVDHKGEGQEATDQGIVPETRHLIGREPWLAGVQQMVQRFPAKKLIVLQGPVGVGKSSELMRLADAFQNTHEAGYRVIWLPFPAAQSTGGPEAALDVFLGTVLSACGMAPFPSETPRSKLITALLAHLEKRDRPTVILLDNAEGCLEESGTLATCWEAFIDQFICHRHQATLILATKEWQGWPGRESTFIAETFVPPLTPPECVSLLQRLGLEEIPEEQLKMLGRRMTGIPLLLEWTAKLVIDPLQGENWAGLDESQTSTETSTTQGNVAKRLSHLLDDPTLLGEHLANKLAPLLQRILEKYLSDEARLVLTRLSVATIPLGKAALQVLCPRMQLLRELRSASLLARYTNRFELLPVVAWTVQQQLAPEQRRKVESEVIQAYTCWLDEGNLEIWEAGTVVTELAVLLLTHQRLLEAAELLVRQAWLSFHCGSGSRLARLAQEVLGQVEWHQSIEEECMGLAIVHTLFPFLGEPLRMQEHGNYPRLREAFLAGELSLSGTIERSTTHLLLLDAIEFLRFEEGQAIVDVYCRYLKARQIKDPQQETGLIQEQAFLYSRWGDYLLGQGKPEQANVMREQAIALYRQCVTLFAPLKTSSLLAQSMCKRGMAYASAFLGYHLNQIGRPEEALPMIQQALDFHEQKYGETCILADSYSEKAQVLMALGRFQEALRCDELAMSEIHRWAQEGDIYSQEDAWTYQVNRGRLYVRLGRMEEAERLLLEAEPRLSRSRRNYQMFAKEALDEIAQWRKQSRTSQNQLDWRWVERFRILTAYDSYWWLTWAGPFTAEEQHEWDRLFAPPLDETTKTQLGALMTSSRERELAAALEEQREPRLHYPAIEIEEIRRRIEAQQRLDAEITKLEPNVIVKKLYQEAIANELDYLHLIEATYEGNTERFWECAKRSDPPPSREEMVEALGYVQDLIERGLAAPEPAVVQATRQFQEYLSTQFHLSPDLLAEAAAFDKLPPVPAGTSSGSERTISAEAAQRFFATALQDSGYEGWRVVLDPHGGMPRVEGGARSVFLPDKRYPLEEIRHLFVHELAGHVGRRVAGERSRLGLLGLQMKNYGPTHEGVAFYHERQVLASHGESLNEAGMRLGMLAVGLAAGVITPPQTFRRLCLFIEQLVLLNMSLGTSQAELSDEQRQRAHHFALATCLRKYRGVPDLEQAGICYTQDVIHLRGLRLVERAVAADANVLDHLSVGVCTQEHLPDLQELGILSTPQPLLHLAYATDLDEYIYSFETSTEEGGI